MSKRKEVEETWPGFDWIQHPNLREVAFTLHGEGCKVSCLAQKRWVVLLVRDSALKIVGFMGDDRPVAQDILIAGVCLRRPFTGVSLAMQSGVSDAA